MTARKVLMFPLRAVSFPSHPPVLSLTRLHTGMPIITIPELRSHLRLNDNSEDVLLAGYIDSAEIMFTNFTGRTLDTNVATGFPAGIPSPLKRAVTLMAGHFYLNRENYTEQRLEALPFGFLSICRQYAIRYVGPGAA
jgi:uncharacterized phage protein (predicted DNA packaging)